MPDLIDPQDAPSSQVEPEMAATPMSEFGGSGAAPALDGPGPEKPGDGNGG